MFCKKCSHEIKEGQKYCTNCGNDILTSSITKRKKPFFTKRKLLIFVIPVIGITTILAFLYQNNLSGISSKDKKDQEIASSVVNIYCKGKKGEKSSGGSGTILTEKGLILTNAHIIPDGAKDTVSCVVILPDPSTGSPDEIYTAYPIVIDDLSEKYDLAFVQVDDVYYDEEEGKTYGEYPKKFPAYDSSNYCKDETVKLGEQVRIYGYPAISGGFALTVTDGIVSSLLQTEGLIITSAKISHGNSGGLAVDQNGCSIGIPSMVRVDDYESLGVIISNDTINEFIEELHNLYD